MSVLEYSSAITKMRGMYKGILLRTGYVELLGLYSVSEIVSYLRKSKSYSEAFCSLPENMTHRAILEMTFDRALIKDSYSLSLMLGTKQTRMMDILMSRMEINMLKRVIRSVYTGIEETQRVFENQYKESSFDAYDCMKSRDFTELLDKLKGSGYDIVLRPCVKADSEDTFSMEEALDEYYYSRIKEGAKKYLSAKDRDELCEFLGSEIDVQNILWAYRYKKYYRFSKEDTINHLIPNKYKINRRKLLEIADSNVEDFDKVISTTHYAPIFKDFDNKWDKAAANYLCRMYTRKIKRNEYSFTSLIAYLFLKEVDIQNIITIIESTRYGMEKSRIEGYLIKG